MQYPFSFDVPSPISILPFNTNHPIYSLRATADASTPSTSSIDTPVQDRFVVQPTPITADESCQGYSYSGQAAPPCQCMPSDPLDGFPWASSSSKPCLNGEGAICGYQAPSSALLNPHRVMCQHPQHPSLAYSTTNPPVQPCPRSSGPPVFVPRACHAHSFTLAQASHVYPPPPLMQHHRHTEVNVVYDLTTSTAKSTQTSTTTMTVLQTGLPSSANASAALAPNPCPPYAPTRYVPHHHPLVWSRLTSNGWQPPNTYPYVAPAPLPTLPVPSVPLYHPKPVHPLPEWTKKSSLVLDEFFSEEYLNTDSSTILAHDVPPLPSGSDAPSLGECWSYGAPVASAAIEEMIDPQDSSGNGDDDDDCDDYDEEDDDDDIGDNDDDEYDDDEMEDDFEMEVLSGIDPEMPQFHATPSGRQAPFCGTLSSAAVPLSSSSLLCQPLPDFVQNQFRASAA
ncbi:hypothetical protein EDB89DRAFT_1928831 [Lactarius sanguifluus]|nr:hypothetical protein EDB89DRAFT_1928831 [Lactarius sanguifluus]